MMRDKFEAAGLDPALMRIKAALQAATGTRLFLTIGRDQELARMAEAILRVGIGMTPPAMNRDDGDHYADISSEIDAIPSQSSRQNADGSDQRQRTMKNGEAIGIAPSAPARSKTVREALIASRTATAEAVLFRLHDGRDVMSVRFSELPHYAEFARQQAGIVGRIISHVSNAPPDAIVGDILTADTLRRMLVDERIAPANEGADHAA